MKSLIYFFHQLFSKFFIFCAIFMVAFLMLGCHGSPSISIEDRAINQAIISIPSIYLNKYSITHEKIQQCIINSAKSRQWTVDKIYNNHIQFSIKSRLGNTATIDVEYNDSIIKINYISFYSPTYEDSYNKEFYFTRYNKWVTILAIDIRKSIETYYLYTKNNPHY